jgi:zinc finger protein AEBP2
MLYLQTKHVNPQTFSDSFICLWNGCKVFGKASCSRTFLERHVLTHGGNKPYRCIVDNCGQRFSSQVNVERNEEVD